MLVVVLFKQLNWSELRRVVLGAPLLLKESNSFVVN